MDGAISAAAATAGLHMEVAYGFSYSFPLIVLIFTSLGTYTLGFTGSEAERPAQLDAPAGASGTDFFA